MVCRSLCSSRPCIEWIDGRRDDAALPNSVIVVPDCLRSTSLLNLRYLGHPSSGTCVLRLYIIDTNEDQHCILGASQSESPRMVPMSQAQIADGRRTKKRGSSGLLVCVSPTSSPFAFTFTFSFSLFSPIQPHLHSLHNPPPTYLPLPTITRFVNSPSPLNISDPRRLHGPLTAPAPILRNPPRCGAFSRGVVSRPPSSAL